MFTFAGVQDTKKEFTLLEAGNYEAIITDAEVKETSNGVKFIEIVLSIPSEKRKLWKKMFPNKETGEPTAYMSKQLSKLCQLAEVPVGTQFATFEEMLVLFVGVAVQVKVEKKFDSYRNAEVNEVAFFNTPVNPAVYEPEAPELVEETSFETTDFGDDLPF